MSRPNQKPTPDGRLGEPSLPAQPASLPQPCAVKRLAVKSPLELLAMRDGGLKTKPRKLRPEIPQAAEDAIAKALMFRAEERYASAQEMAQALVSSLSGFAGMIPPPAWPTRRRLLTLGAAAAGMLAGAGAVALMQKSTGPREPVNYRTGRTECRRIPRRAPVLA